MPTAVQIQPATPSTLLRLAVVEFETPSSNVFEKRGSYGDMAVKLLRRTLTSSSAADETPLLLKVTKICALEGDAFPENDEFDAALVTGSKYTVAHDNAWVPSLMGFIRRAYAAEKPLAGICYGHQMITRALGGQTSRNPGGWELSVCPVNFTPTGADMFGSESLAMYQMHRDAVISPPPNVQVIASSPGCHVQVMYQPRRVLGFQGHPEVDRATTESFLRQRVDEGILETSVYEEGMTRIGRKHDGALIAAVMCRFFCGKV